MTKDISELGESVAERTLQMVTALTAEVAVLRERLEVIELLGERNGTLAPGAVDGFRPDAATAQRLKRRRLALIDSVFRHLRVSSHQGAKA